MVDVIETIVDDWSRQIPSGIIDISNEDHLYELLHVLNKNISDHVVVRGVMENIRKQMREEY